MVTLDTDVLTLAYAFHRDSRSAANAQFLTVVQAEGPATTIYTVMELLGKLSFNLSGERLAQWPSWLQVRYQLTIRYPSTMGLNVKTFFHSEFVRPCFRKMQRFQIPFLDSLMLNLAEDTPEVQVFVTWNARHYRGKTPLTVLAPADYLWS